MIKDTESLIVDINAPRVHHRALTGFLRRNWSRSPNTLKRIVYNTDVSPYLGALPPQLRARVPQNQIASVTAQFRECLENFLIQNIFDLREMESDRIYDLPEIGALFGTGCNLVARGVNVYGVNPWSGLLGFVCKLSFPDINAHYALKLYYSHIPEVTHYSHGPWFEFGTALAANKAEARDNVPMYMASLKYEKYMLSQWAGDREDGVPQRDNKYRVFVTRTNEDESRNRRGGRRIDWGETYLSKYGQLSYPARKIYRQAINLDEAGLRKSIANARNNFERRDVRDALGLAETVAWYDDNQPLTQLLYRVQKQR